MTDKIHLSYEQAQNLYELFSGVNAQVLVGFDRCRDLAWKYIMKHYTMDFYCDNWEENDCGSDEDKEDDL